MEILKDLKAKYSESIQQHHLQTSHGFNEVNSIAINNFSSSDANSSFHSDEYHDFQNLENLDVKDIEKLLFGHKKEKERFLSAVATFNRTASEFYKLFQVARQHLLKNQIQEAEQLTKLNNSKLNNFSLNSASKSQTSADFFL